MTASPWERNAQQIANGGGTFPDVDNNPSPTAIQ
jgi:hypothetical protein